MKISLDSYAEMDYKKYTVEADEIVDLYWGTTETQTTKHTLHIFGEGSSDDSLETSTGEDTDDIYLYYNTTLDSVQAFYKDPSDNKVKYYATNASTGAQATFAYITYQDSRLEVDWTWDAAYDDGNITFDTANGDDIVIFFKEESNQFGYLGHSDGDTIYANDLLYGTSDRSGWEEDTRTENGIVVYDPKAHLSGDSFEFNINGDESDFKVNVVILGPSGSSTSSGDSVRKVVPVTNAVAKLDTEVSLPVGKHLVLVGGPAVNRLSATALGLQYPTYGSSGLLPFEEGEGYIELTNGVVEAGQYAVVVCGWEAADTRDATSVLQQFDSFESQLDGNMAVKVTGVSASGITAAS
jgi:hypothetical protein